MNLRSKRGVDFSAHNPRTSNALNIAARNNDVPNLRRLLRKINPNCVDNRGWTCLHEAAFADSLDCLKIILKRRNCRPLVESHEGHTALYVACQNPFTTSSIQYLLENVEDIANFGSREGFTPLHLVSRQGRTDVLILLIQHGAILDAVDFDGDTPLHEACMGCQPLVVNILVHAGAPAEVPNDRKGTPLHMACSRGCFESVKNLYPFITEINVLDSNGDTPLMTACHGENEDIIEFLLKNGANPNHENFHGKMAIDLALERGLVRGFKLIFQATDNNEISLDLVFLAMSPSYLNIEIIDMLLASDLDPEYFMFTKSWLIETPEIIPAQRRAFVPCYNEFAPMTTFLNVAEYIYKMSVDKLNEFMYLFLMKGMSVNAIQCDEMPPLVWLHYCPHSKCFEYVLNLMVQLGCDVDYCSKMFCSPNNLESLHARVSTSVFKPVDQLDFEKLKDFPDAFYSSMLVDPVTLPVMLTYSLVCDPGYILRSAYEFGVIERLSTSTISQLMKMIDHDCEVTDYEGFKNYIPSLKHLSRIEFRREIKHKIRPAATTQYFLNILDKLPLPRPIKKYLRFL